MLGIRVGARRFSPSVRVLAAQCVRALPVPRELPRGDGAVGGARAPMGTPEAGLTYPPRAAKAPCAPKARRSASRRSTNHHAVDRFRAPPPGQLSLCPLDGHAVGTD